MEDSWVVDVRYINVYLLWRFGCGDGREGRKGKGWGLMGIDFRLASFLCLVNTSVFCACFRERRIYIYIYIDVGVWLNQNTLWVLNHKST